MHKAGESMRTIMIFRNFAIAATSVMTLFATSFNVQAGFLSWNSNPLEALDLNGKYSSFEEFYDYNRAFRWSSNMGLEEADVILMFVAELDNEYGVFSTISSPVGGSAGKVRLDFSASAGSMLFFDDPDESTDNSGINFRYASNRNDGFIYGGLGEFDWSFTTMFSGAENIDGLKFITFNGGNLNAATYSNLFSIDEPLTISNQRLPTASNSVSEPGTLLLMLLGGGSMLARLRKKV